MTPRTKKTFFATIFLFILIPSIASPQLKVKKKMIFEVSIDLKGPAKMYYIDPPVYVYETFENDRFLIPGDVIFEVFDAKGKLITKRGDKGNGPGDFTIISTIKKGNQLYYFQDFPNKISIYDRDFNFKKRVFLSGPKTSLYVNSFALMQDNIISGQLWGTPQIHCIIEYDGNGKFQRSFFKKKFGWDVYPFKALLGKFVAAKEKNIFFVFDTIPKIWKLNAKGGIVAEKNFGENWWKKIQYNRREYMKKKKKVGSLKALKELILSGDAIKRIWTWKDNVVLQIIRDSYDNPINSFLIISDDLKRESKLVSYQDYQFCGAGNYLYFSKLVSMDRERNKKTVEVIQCDYEF